MYKLSIQVYTGKNMFRGSIKECNFIPQIGWSLKIPKTWQDEKDEDDSKLKITMKDENGNIIETIKVKDITYNATKDFFQVDCCTFESEEQYEETFGGNNEGELNWWRSKLFEILDIVPTSDYTHLLEKNDWWKKIKREYERRERI